MKKRRDSFKQKFILYFIGSLVVVFLISFVAKVYGIGKIIMNYLGICIVGDRDVGGMFFAQISTTFIVVSVVSLLTSNTQQVYWDDVVHRKLLSPPILNFSSLSAFMLACLGVSIFFYIQNSLYIIIPFISSIIAMGVFTVKVLSSHFGRKNVKEMMRSEFLKCTTDNSVKIVEMGARLKQAINESEFSVVEENIELFSSYIEKNNKYAEDSVQTNIQYIEILLSECIDNAYNGSNQMCIFHIIKGVILSHNWEKIEKSFNVILSIDDLYLLLLVKIWENALCDKNDYYDENSINDGFFLLCQFMLDIMIKKMKATIGTSHFYSGREFKRQFKSLGNKKISKKIGYSAALKMAIENRWEEITELFKSIDLDSPIILGLNYKYEFINTLYELTMGSDELIQKLKENIDTSRSFEISNPVLGIIFNVEGLRDRILEESERLDEKKKHSIELQMFME